MSSDAVVTEAPQGRRGGGRAGRRREQQEAAAKAKTAVLRQWKLPYAPIEAVSEDAVEAIHEASMRVIEELGIKVLHEDARRLYRAAGADVDEARQIVRMDRALLMELVGKAPSSFKMHGRNPDWVGTTGDGNILVATVGGPPHATDLDRGRRNGNMPDYENFCRLAQAYDVIHIFGQPVEPQEIPLNVRHLHMTRAVTTLTEKVPFVYSRGHGAVMDALEIVRIGRGISWDQFKREPSAYTVVNMNSPRQLDIPMAQGMIDMAKMGQPVVVTPFTLAGAMAPVTVAGGLVQQNAEALFGIALIQIVNPGNPAVYGGFTSNVDMKSGAPAFGTPEYAQAQLVSGQLTRKYKLPYRSSNVNASNHPDVQSAYESQMSLWSTIMGGCNFLLHGAGWLEGGLSASFEKFIIDVEMLRAFEAFLSPLEVNPDTLGLEAIRDVDPGGHYFGTPHTLARFDKAFYEPLLSDWRNFETWQEDGSVDATQRANRIYKQALKDYEEPDMDAGIREEMNAFVDRRTREGGVELD